MIRVVIICKPSSYLFRAVKLAPGRITFSGTPPVPTYSVLRTRTPPSRGVRAKAARSARTNKHGQPRAICGSCHSPSPLSPLPLLTPLTPIRVSYYTSSSVHASMALLRDCVGAIQPPRGRQPVAKRPQLMGQYSRYGVLCSMRNLTCVTYNRSPFSMYSVAVAVAARSTTECDGVRYQFHWPCSLLTTGSLCF